MPKTNEHQPTKSLGVIGCGWLGMAVAKDFIKKGWRVKGTVRKEENKSVLEAHNIQAFKYILGKQDADFSSFLNNLDLLLIAVPPGLRKGSAHEYLKNLELLKRQLKEDLPAGCRVLFISSTGVYPSQGGPYSEHSSWEAHSEKADALLAAEKIISQLAQESCVIRFSGLIGPGRDPLRSLIQRDHIAGGHLAANLIDQKDGLRLLWLLSQIEQLPRLLNAVYPQKIKKADFYSQKALALGMSPPNFTQGNLALARHIVSEIELPFKYKHPV